jgi:hypothetical protein
VRGKLAIADASRTEQAVCMGKPTDDELNGWFDGLAAGLSPMTSQLDQQLSFRDRRAAEDFATCIAIHVGEGGFPDLDHVHRLGHTKRKFERGRTAFSRVFPGDPFEVVRQFGLVDVYSASPDARAWQTIRVTWKRAHSTPSE